MPSGKIIVSVIEQGLFVLETTGLAKSENSFVNVRKLFAEHQNEPFAVTTTSNEEENAEQQQERRVTKVSITVHDHDDVPAENAKVIGTFDNSRDNIQICFTNESGVCSITHVTTKTSSKDNNNNSNGVGGSDDLVTFQVLGIEKIGHHYKSTENVADEHTDGKHITVSRNLSRVVRRDEASSISKVVKRVKRRAGVVPVSMTPSVEAEKRGTQEHSSELSS